MDKKRILYYSWNEITMDDAVEVLTAMGNELFIDKTKYSKFDEDIEFMKIIEKKIISVRADIIFSFNYYPDLSRVAMKTGILYVSWCYDSPLLTLQSVTLGNNCNRVFIFDRGNYLKLKGLGINTVYHMPLACNTDRLNTMFNNKKINYEHDITFLGNLYDDENNFFSKIEYLPDYLKGYFDAVLEAQVPIYGLDLVDYLIRDDIAKKALQYIKVNMGAHYRECERDILVSMLQKQITSNERKRLLTVLGENYNVDLYSSRKPDNMKVTYKGIADYYNQMPVIFRTSKINLNISLRTILTGIPLRVIDVMGAGGFLITNYQDEMAEYFVNGENIVWYGSYEELFEQIDFYIKNDDIRERIAKAGKEIVDKEFSYRRMFERIFSEI